MKPNIQKWDCSLSMFKWFSWETNLLSLEQTYISVFYGVLGNTQQQSCARELRMRASSLHNFCWHNSNQATRWPAPSMISKCQMRKRNLYDTMCMALLIGHNFFPKYLIFYWAPEQQQWLQMEKGIRAPHLRIERHLIQSNWMWLIEPWGPTLGCLEQLLGWVYGGSNHSLHLHVPQMEL